MLILFSTSHPSKGTPERSAKLVNWLIPLGKEPVIGDGNGSGIPSGNSSVLADATINKVAPIVEKHFIIIIFKFL